MALSLAWHIVRTTYFCPSRIPNSALFTELSRTQLSSRHFGEQGLVCLLTFRGRIGAQPQGDVCGLHRLPYHPN
jgi:hypothetical protein